MFSETAVNIIELYNIIEIIEDTPEYCVGIDKSGTEFRFEPAEIGNCISVSHGSY